MKRSRRFASILAALCALCAIGISCSDRDPKPTPPPPEQTSETPKTFSVRGVVQELKADGHTVIVNHEEITNYMDAMTMPFHVRATNELTGLRPGNEITFRLLVTEERSWIDRVIKTGRSNPLSAVPAPADAATNLPPTFRITDIPDFALTNEFGAPVRLRQFQGKALGLTFFFTRCPIPEYCPRLTKNFRGAIDKLKAQPGGPTNFHFLSISFDPIDTPTLLRAYGKQYRYDSNHWSFLTGHPDQIRELARGFGVSIAPGGAIYDHGFRTAIFDAAGGLQTMWPFGGDMTKQIVKEITKAAANQ